MVRVTIPAKAACALRESPIRRESPEAYKAFLNHTLRVPRAGWKEPERRATITVDLRPNDLMDVARSLELVKRTGGSEMSIVAGQAAEIIFREFASYRG